MVRNHPKRKERDYNLLPKNRSPIGRFSGAKRNFERETILKEPDKDRPEEWLTKEKREDPKYIAEIEQIWREWTEKPGGWSKDQSEIFWTGQSHIDIAWEWRLPQTIDKARVTYAKACFHAEQIPGYIFATSQPLTLEFVRQRNEELFEKIQETHRKGQFELVGGLWVEPDARMPSGEAFIRQRLYGQHYYLKYFGEVPKVEWLPDTFGYAWSMPQIIQKSGGEYFFTTKVWGNHEKFPDAPWPFTNFWWQGPDGSRILAHIQPQMFGPIPNWPQTRQLSKLVRKGEEFLADYQVDHPEKSPKLSDDPDEYVRELGVFFGWGDGGHGPTGEEVARQQYYMQQGVGKWSSVHNYFSILREKYQNRLPIWNDELYFQAHQGTMTTQGMMKRWNRALEWRIAGIETFATLLEMLGGPEVNYAGLTQVWKDICTNQFHDILPGSSIPEVYDDTYDYFLQDRVMLDAIEQNMIQNISSGLNCEEKETFVCLNYMANKRIAIVSMPCDEEWGTSIHSVFLKNSQETRHIAAQFIKGDEKSTEPLMKQPDRIEFVVEFEPFEMKYGWFSSDFIMEKESQQSQDLFIIQENNEQITISNDLIKIEVDPKTGLVEKTIFDPKSSKPISIFRDSAFQLRAYADFVKADAWEISTEFREEPMEWEIITPAKIIERGPVRVTIEYQTCIEDGDSIFTHRIVIYQKIAAIFSEILVDWKDPGVLVKIFYPTNTDSKESIAEIPAATIKRKIERIASHDIPRWEVFCQTFVDMPSKENTWGISFINEGKYGYATVDGGFELTLLRMPHYPLVAAEAWCKEERRLRMDAGEDITSATDQHWHLIRQMIVPHRDSWEQAKIADQAHGFNMPIQAHRIESIADQKTKDNSISQIMMNQSNSLLILEGKGLEVMMIKPWEPLIAQNEKGYILRILNNSEQPITGKIQFHPNLEIKEIIDVDLLERMKEHNNNLEEQPSSYNRKKNILEAQWNQFEIRTFLLK